MEQGQEQIFRDSCVTDIDSLTNCAGPKYHPHALSTAAQQAKRLHRSWLWAHLDACCTRSTAAIFDNVGTASARRNNGGRGDCCSRVDGSKAPFARTDRLAFRAARSAPYWRFCSCLWTVNWGCSRVTCSADVRTQATAYRLHAWSRVARRGGGDWTPPASLMILPFSMLHMLVDADIDRAAELFLLEHCPGCGVLSGRAHRRLLYHVRFEPRCRRQWLSQNVSLFGSSTSFQNS